MNKLPKVSEQYIEELASLNKRAQALHEIGEDDMPLPVSLGLLYELMDLVEESMSPSPAKTVLLGRAQRCADRAENPPPRPARLVHLDDLLQDAPDWTI